MIPPLLSQNSRKLLQRFFAREARFANKSSSVTAAASTSSASTPSTPSQTTPSTFQWTTQNNPFSSSLVKNSRGHNKYRSAKYSPRRQKQLYRAMEIVKLQQELFKPISSQAVAATEGTTAENAAIENTFAIPEHWVLPPSLKSKNMPSFSSIPSTSATTSSTIRSSAQPSYTAKDATERGPYKGRRNEAFKLHQWERDHQSKLDARKEKLESMPQRIAEYTKARAAARLDAKPSLPF